MYISLVKLKLSATLLCFMAFAGFLSAQQRPPGSGTGGNRAAMNIGHFYGKVVDETGKGVGYASVQLYGMRFDTVTKERKEALLAGQITEENGDFSLEKVPVSGEFNLKITFLGFATIEQKVSFGAPAGSYDKDLGNIVLSETAQTLGEVVVKGEASSMMLTLDKKVFRVDKDATATGGTAEDALKNVPSLAVDLDGNLTLRNAAPQLFVDGRPTTLTLDQIPADAIETVEVITNPSAKYDASGGQAGIVNIVMKKDRRIGYNGSIRAGTDTRGGYNAGGDISLREGKVNAFLSANYNQRVSRGSTETDRQNLFGMPLTNVLQTGSNEFKGTFRNLRGGLDWFVDNRNTLTFSGSFTKGDFLPEDQLRIKTDSLFSTGITSSEANRSSMTERGFQNAGGSILYKHLFPKEGKEWTADINYNEVSIGGGGDFTTTFSNTSFVSRERQETDGGSKYLTVQTDYEEPLGENMKIELGARASIRNYENNNFSSYFDKDLDDYVPVSSLTDQYQFDDKVYAVYGTFSQEFSKWGYMVGLRAESSQYTGTLPQADASFNNDYPLSLFPSVFLTRKLNEEDNLQLSYTRRINRPNFFQLIPFTDFSDSLNLRRGNPNLLPEFTNSLELSYQNIFEKGHNLLVSIYYKEATDLITTYQFSEFDEILGREAIVTSFVNSNSSLAYGAEFTLKNTLSKSIELTSNLNFYNSRVDASNLESNLINKQFTWFAKENLQIKLPAQFSLQISGEYRSRAAFTPNDGGGRFGGYRGGPTNTAQGYSLENWFVDAALRKDLFNRKASLTVSIQDIFRSRRSGSYTESEFFVQDTWRLRDPQVVRVNFS